MRNRIMEADAAA